MTIIIANEIKIACNGRDSVKFCLELNMGYNQQINTAKLNCYYNWFVCRIKAMYNLSYCHDKQTKAGMDDVSYMH